MVYELRLILLTDHIQANELTVIKLHTLEVRLSAGNTVLHVY